MGVFDTVRPTRGNNHDEPEAISDAVECEYRGDVIIRFITRSRADVTVCGVLEGSHGTRAGREVVGAAAFNVIKPQRR